MTLNGPGLVIDNNVIESQLFEREKNGINSKTKKMFFMKFYFSNILK